MKPVEGRKRVVIEEVQPQVDCGRYPAKRILGDTVTITAAIFGDGHDHVAARLLYRHSSEPDWRFTPLTALTNDLWTVTFTVDKLGDWLYTIEAWVDHFDTWCADLRKRLAAQPAPAAPNASSESQDIPLAFRTGAMLLAQAAQRAKGPDSNLPRRSRGQSGPPGRTATPQPTSTRSATRSSPSSPSIPISPSPPATGRSYISGSTANEPATPPGTSSSRDPPPLTPLATAPSPTSKRSCPASPPWASTCSTCRPSTPSAPHSAKAATTTSSPTQDDPGSPWAIGSKEGGHKSIHSQLGTFATSTHSSPPRTTTAWSWPSTSPFSARPTTPGSPSIPTGSTSAPTAPSSTPKIRQRNIRTSTPSTSNPPTGAASGRLSAMSSPSGFAATSASSASTIRTPKPFPSGSGASPRSTRNIPTSSFSPRPSPAPTSCTRSPRPASPSPTPTSPGATPGTSSRNTSKRSPNRQSPISSAPTSGPTRPTSSTPRSRTAAARPSCSVSSSPPRSARTTASTAPPSS